MYDMQKVRISVRELQQNLKRVMATVERGQVIELTRHGRPIASLAPIPSDGARAPWPDLGARMRTVYGEHLLPSGGSDAVSEGRGDR